MDLFSIAKILTRLLFKAIFGILFILPGRLTVGLRSLEADILVRIQARQPI